MTSSELKSEFRIMFEDLATSGSKGLDDYEMSVCLTVGQDNVIMGLVAEGNMDQLRKLIKYTETNMDPADAEIFGAISYWKVPIADSVLVALDRVIRGVEVLPDTSIKTYGIEGVTVPPGTIAKLHSAAYKYPPKNVAYVMVGEGSDSVFPPLNFPVKSHMLAHIEKPQAITIGGQPMGDLGVILVDGPPSLPSGLHRSIIKAGVEYAVGVYIGQPEKQVQDGGSGNK